MRAAARGRPGAGGGPGRGAAPPGGVHLGGDRGGQRRRVGRRRGAGPAGPCCAPAVEHSAVREASARRAPVVALAVDRRGPDRRRRRGRRARAGRGPGPALVHCQWANHEVGTVQPVAEVVGLCPGGGGARARRRRPPPAATSTSASTDARAPTSSRSAPTSSAGRPASARWWSRRGTAGRTAPRRRPAGAGAPGRDGERRWASSGFGAAAAALAGGGSGRRRRGGRGAPGALARARPSRRSPSTGWRVVGDPDPAGRLPHLVCLGVDGVEAEPVLLGLDRAGVAAHSGSACSSESLEPSPVLAAMGVDPSHSLRLSVGWSTTEADVDAFAGAFADGGGRPALPTRLRSPGPRSPGPRSSARAGAAGTPAGTRRCAGAEGRRRYPAAAATWPAGGCSARNSRYWPPAGARRTPSRWCPR